MRKYHDCEPLRGFETQRLQLAAQSRLTTVITYRRFDAVPNYTIPIEQRQYTIAAHLDGCRKYRSTGDRLPIASFDRYLIE
jgi:hypothetical protein